MAGPSQNCVLLFEATRGRAAPLRALLRDRGLTAHTFELNEPSAERVLGAADVAAFLIEPNTLPNSAARIADLCRRLESERVAALLWGAPTDYDLPDSFRFERLPSSVSLEEVVGRLTVLARYVPALKRLDSEIEHLQRLGQQLNRHFAEVDKDMRLAGRLQRELLPQRLPESPPLRFAHLYRPAAWVSGDMYDVFVSADGLINVFVADAMGHGTAAGLMTMFLRRGLAALRDGERRTDGPREVLGRLHDDLAGLELQGAQFVTAVHAQIDPRLRELRLARGGHPHPVRIDAAGEVTEIIAEGSLLGIPGLELGLSEQRAQLRPGDRLLFYTDGLESLLFGAAEPDRPRRPSEHLERWARLGAVELVRQVESHLDHQEGSLNPEDDVTLIVAEVL